MYAIKLWREGDAFPRPKSITLAESTADLLISNPGENERVGARWLHHFHRRLHSFAIGHAEMIRPDAILYWLSLLSRRIGGQRQFDAVIRFNGPRAVAALQPPRNQIHRR